MLPSFNVKDASLEPRNVFGEPHECGLSDRPSISYIYNGDEEIGAMAAGFLREQGNYRSFAFVHARDVGTWSLRRFNGFSAALAKFHKPCDAFDWNGGSLTEFIRSKPLPLAVMAACDLYAVNVVSACRSLNLKIPEHVALIGVDNEELMCELTTPSISSIAPNYRHEGSSAARELDRLLSEKIKRPQSRTLKFKTFTIFPRESTAPLSPSAALVESALNFIRTHAHEPIRVSDVVRHVGTSRRLLDLRFRQLQNETVADAILRIRLEEVRSRILSSRLSFSKLAANCGFRNPGYLKKVFRKHFGSSPEDLRPDLGTGRKSGAD